MTAEKTLIIGIGNPYCGDDALGCLVARELATRITPELSCVEHDGEPASLIDCWQHMERVFLIDAVSSKAEPGHIFRINLTQQALPDEFNLYSTHAFGIPQAIELARVLGKLPPNIHFFGVEGLSFAAGESLSAQVETAKHQVIIEIMNILEIKKSHEQTQRV